VGSVTWGGERPGAPHPKGRKSLCGQNPLGFGGGESGCKEKSPCLRGDSRGDEVWNRETLATFEGKTGKPGKKKSNQRGGSLGGGAGLAKKHASVSSSACRGEGGKKGPPVPIPPQSLRVVFRHYIRDGGGREQ